MSWSLGNSDRLRFQRGFTGLENLRDSEDLNRAWENIKENIKISAKGSQGMHELKQH